MLRRLFRAPRAPKDSVLLAMGANLIGALALTLFASQVVLAQSAPAEPEKKPSPPPSPTAAGEAKVAAPAPDQSGSAGTASSAPATPTAATTRSPTTGARAADGKQAAAADQAKAPPAPQTISVTKKGMGGRLQIQVFPGAGNEGEARQAIAAAFDELARVESLMSEWRPQSDISKLNAKAGNGEAIAVAKETLQVLKRGKEISIASNGAFAMTWAVLASLWDFGQAAEEVKKLPDAVKAQEKSGLVDDRKIELDEEKGTARLVDKGMALGLGGIAKGYAIGRALAVLSQKGVTNALVFIGGDIGVSGSKGDKPWLIGIQDPRAKGYFATIAVKDEAVVTAGDYVRFFEVDNKRYHHILDPRTGYPATGARSVTIVAKEALTADAFATAVFVLGPEAGMKLVEETPEIEAVIVDAANHISMSKNLRNRVRVLRAPTS